MSKQATFLKRRAVVGGFALLTAVPWTSARAQSQAPVSGERAFLSTYCYACHNQRLKTGGLSLETLDVDHPGVHAEEWEKVVRKLSTGMMPPAVAPHPHRADVNAFLQTLETRLDRAAAGHMNPGAPALHRLNRTEYANVIRDLLAVDVDATTLLPADDASNGFDNIADVLHVSPELLDRYLSAAAKISRIAVGDPNIGPTAVTYRVRGDVSQNDLLPGLPLGTRGGIIIHHTFPVDGEYVIKASLLKENFGPTFGGAAKNQQLEIALNGSRVQLFDVKPELFFYMRPVTRTQNARQDKAPLEVRLHVPAGPQTITVTFLKTSSAAVDDLIQPFGSSTADINIGVQFGYTTLPHLASVEITGPFNPAGSGDTPSRRRIFTCQPKSPTDEVPCARQILSTLARGAYRRPVREDDLELLLGFYQSGRNGGTFDDGIEMALRRILADPEFMFRFERDPENVAPGTAYPVSDLELASRLSFFLWSSIPDDELLDVAVHGRLSDPAVLQRQTRRMLQDPRSQALVTNFAGQWLYLRELKNTVPDPLTYPDFDDNLREAFQKETELFFQSIVREDRSVLDLLNADYTFVNGRLAQHYGIPNIYGPDFVRVHVTDQARRGLLGQGSILLLTSNANRTSPVTRGKWILENILGSPPPLPPPNVPPLKDNGNDTKVLSVRERMEQHRANPVCAACHKIMDPIGFSLENFDGVGKWRTLDSGLPIDTSGQLVDGTHVEGPATLRQALLGYSDAFVNTVSEKLLTYAVGRELQYYDMPAVRAIASQAKANGYRFSSLIAATVASQPFRMRLKKAGASPNVALGQSHRPKENAQ